MSSGSGTISVVVVDDEPDIVEYLRVLLDLEGFAVVGTARDADGAVRVADSAQPDVVLLDLDMPGGGLDAARRIAVVSPATRVVVFSASAASLQVLPLLAAGIHGYVLKGSPPERVTEAIRVAVRGGAYLTPEITGVALDALSSRLQTEERAEVRLTELSVLMVEIINGSLFRSVHQPIIELRTNRATGVEALTRFMPNPQRPPDAWFEEADQVGARISLELATARAALHCLDRLRSDLYMTVNISPATALSGRLAEILSGIDLHRIVLEVTEHAPVIDYPALLAVLRPWRERGARLAVDDAGGGYASFAHILNLSPEFIKLDIGLIRGIDRDPQRQALARAICGFANDLGVTVVAEGVETAAELAVVAAIGTPSAQGFHLGRPLPLSDQPSLLEPSLVTRIDLTEPARRAAAS